ncbi:MAG: ribonuclease R [Bacteroidota bacterium]
MKANAELKKRVLTYLAQRPGKSATLKDLSRRLKIRNKDDHRVLRNLIENLVDDGVISADRRGWIRYGGKERKRSRDTVSPTRIVGTMAVLRRGGGIVRSDGTGEEIAVPARFMRTALHRDTVAVVLFARPMRRRGAETQRPEGEVVEVIRRGTKTITGVLERRGHFYVVVPDDERMSRDVYIPAENASQVGDGKKVVVELDEWTDEHLNPEGTIVEVLGPSGDARVEVTAVARGFGLPLSFAAEVLDEASSLPDEIPQREIDSRLDLRKTVCLTIDPEDARDFDDAVSLETLSGDRYRLGVHIADVSHYVKPGTALDAEALSRATSVYLVNEVIHMLPDRLSTDLCSLRPQRDRLAYSALIDLNKHGTVEKHSIRKSVIRSARRFTYEEVQRILESGNGEFSEVLLPLWKLSKRLRSRRRSSGSLDLDTPEAKFVFDEQGLPSRINKKERLDAHRLVEECMLLANRVVAGHLTGKKERPTVYRVHDAPDPSRLSELAQFVRQFGFSLPGKEGITSRELQKLLDAARGSDVENLITEVVLRSMAKAVYSTKNIGHYGLGFGHYTHFTSPIRRYPDLVVHRLLREYEHPVSIRRLEELRKSLPSVARQSSERERVAQEAERTSVKVMQVEYMKRHLGDTFDGVISGVLNFGFFVEIEDLLVEGLVRMRDLSDDYYLYDEKRYALKGRSKGKVYRLGDHVRVRVLAVNPEDHEIDFQVES